MASHVRALLPWLCFLIAVYAVYGLESALASVPTTLGAWPTESGVSRALPLRTHVADTERIRGTIILHDADTGRDLKWQCMFSPDNPLPADLVVDANAWAEGKSASPALDENRRRREIWRAMIAMMPFRALG